MICKKQLSLFSLILLTTLLNTTLLQSENINNDNVNATEQDDSEEKNDQTRFIASLMEDDTCAQEENVCYDDEDDNSYFFDPDDPKFATGGPIYTEERTYAEVIVPSLSQCRMIDMFKQDMYLNTYPLPERTLLDDPLFYAPLSSQDKTSLKWQLFFNQTSKQFFTKEQDGIGSYLALDNSPFVNSLQNSFETIHQGKAKSVKNLLIHTLDVDPQYLNVDMHTSFGLFKNIEVQERQAGIMLNLLAPFSNFNLSEQLIFNLKVPLVYRERNFNISKRDQELIKQNVISLYPEAANAPTPSTKDVLKDPFVREYLVRDTFGIGDTRLTLGYIAADKNAYRLTVGPEITIPTGHALKPLSLKGVISTSRENPPARPTFEICELVTLNLPEQVVVSQLSKEFTQMGLSAIDRLSYILLNKELGNGGHWGAGIFVEPTIHLTDTMSLYSKAAVEFFKPENRGRYFLKKVNLAEFDSRNFNEDEDPSIYNDNLNFLNNRLFDMLFPRKLNVQVTPGSVFKFLSMIKHEGETWEFKYGFDYWFQNQENLRFSKIEQSTLDSYHIERGRQPSSQQLKLVSGLGYKTQFGSTNWKFFANGGTTVFSSGIGKDFTVSLGLSMHW